MLWGMTWLSFELLVQSFRSVPDDQRDETNLIVISTATVWVEGFLRGGSEGLEAPQEAKLFYWEGWVW